MARRSPGLGQGPVAWSLSLQRMLMLPLLHMRSRVGRVAGLGLGGGGLWLPALWRVWAQRSRT